MEPGQATGWLDAAPVGWIVGLLAGAVVMGPALGSGSLLNVDLVLVPDPPVPAGAWGLGPELPRRIPLWEPLSWLSTMTDGTIVGKAFVVVAIGAAFAGAWRLAERLAASPPAAATLYALGAFVTTRTAVGHWSILGAMSVLPWAVTPLLDPLRHRRSVLPWAAALGCFGVYGGTVAGLLLATGLVTRPPPRPGRWRSVVGVLATFVVAQLPWAVALAVVTASTGGGDLASASDFAPLLDGGGDLGRLLAGGGFWDQAFQVGGVDSAAFALAGFVLLGLAAFGTRDLPTSIRRPFTTVALVALLLSSSSALPLVDRAVDAFSQTPLGAPFRDSQRYLPPYLLWVAVTAGSGAKRLGATLERGRRPGAITGAAAAVPLAVGLLLAAPGAWGIGGSLRPVHFPPEWREARAAVRAAPGPVVALPWFQYFTLDVAHDRLTLGVVQYYFGGDVISASDPHLSSEPRQEVPDPREPVVATILDDAQAGDHPSADLARAGVRWLALQHDVDWQSYTGVFDDPGLDLVVSGGSLDLYEVEAWRGPVRTEDGIVESRSIAAPLLDVDPSGPATLTRAFQRGWMRGVHAAASTDEGLVALPGGAGPVWYWPSLVVVAADLVTIGALVRRILSRLR